MWKTRRELLACISRSPSLRTGDRRHRRGNPYPLRCASGGPLSFFGKRKGGKNAVKTKALKSFPRLRCRLHRSSLPRVSGCANFAPCFRIVSASPSAMRSALVLPWRDGGKTSASTVRRDVGIAPYGYFEGWCRRADVGSGPYGAFNGRCA